MSYDVSFLWLWLILAALIGGAVGWLTEGPEPQAPWFHGWPRVAVIVFALALVAAATHIFDGRMAVWVETAVLFFAAYVVGALLGGALRRLRRLA